MTDEALPSLLTWEAYTKDSKKAYPRRRTIGGKKKQKTSKWEEKPVQAAKVRKDVWAVETHLSQWGDWRHGFRHRDQGSGAMKSCSDIFVRLVKTYRLSSPLRLESLNWGDSTPHWCESLITSLENVWGGSWQKSEWRLERKWNWGITGNFRYNDKLKYVGKCHDS